MFKWQKEFVRKSLLACVSSCDIWDINTAHVLCPPFCDENFMHMPPFYEFWQSTCCEVEGVEKTTYWWWIAFDYEYYYIVIIIIVYYFQIDDIASDVETILFF